MPDLLRARSGSRLGTGFPSRETTTPTIHPFATQFTDADQRLKTMLDRIFKVLNAMIGAHPQLAKRAQGPLLLSQRARS
jgi:hypothetical protein